MNQSCSNDLVLNLTDISAPQNSSRSGIRSSTHSENAAMSKDSGTLSKFITPFNYLLGPLMITQWRFSNAASCKRLEDDRLKAVFGKTCRGDDLDPSPFGVDSVFATSSSLYDGTLDPTEFYTNEERSQNADGTPSTPFGFFAQRQDEGRICRNSVQNFQVQFHLNLHNLALC